MSDITTEIERLNHDDIVELFEIDARRVGGDRYFFHAGTNELGQAVVWQGDTYLPRAVQMSGFTAEGDQRPSPTMTIANVTGGISALIAEYEDLVGARVIRRRTMVMFLDAANFTAGNPTAAPEQLAADVFYISRRAEETDITVKFDLATPDEALQRQIPAEQVYPHCPAIYRDIDTGCDWDPDSAGPFFDADDRPTNAAGDRCGKRLASCRKRFGDRPLPFMGFPAASLLSS
ncbi:MAG: phage minor tail protein L [Xanthomonadales bacterium]|nr:phage minor tail protein L [Xanthomonadales bacterium]